MLRTKREVREIAIGLSRDLRRRMTRAERIIWERVRDRRMKGKKIIRQCPVFHEAHGRFWFYIVDFYCHEERLAIEIDGDSHFAQNEYDADRTEILNACGIRVVRFTNKEVEEDIDNVLMRLRMFLGA